MDEILHHLLEKYSWENWKQKFRLPRNTKKDVGWKRKKWGGKTRTKKTKLFTHDMAVG